MDLQTFANGDVDYVSKLNANFSAIATLVNAINALLSTTVSTTGGAGLGYFSLFGDTVAVIGVGSYLPSGAGSTLTVAAGFAWVPSLATVVRNASSVDISFSGQSAATYYVIVDSTGTPSRSASSTEALYSVVWDGAAFGTITRLATQAATLIVAALVALAALTPAANKVPYFTSATVAALLTLDTDGTLAANSDTRLATQKAVKTAIAQAITDLVGTAPGVLDTLGEISDAINDDANLYATIVTALALKSPLASPTFTGNPQAPTPTPGDNDTSVATTAFVQDAIAAVTGGGGGIETVASMGTLTHGASSKATPVDTDELPIADSAASWAWKKLTWANVKATLKTYFDTLYPSGSGTSSGTNTGDQTSVTGNAGTATALQTARTIGGTSFDGTANITQPFDVHAFYPGVPTASAKVLRIPVGRAVGFAANFSGSYAKSEVAATGSKDFDVQKNGVSIGTITFAAAATSATFVTASGTSKSLAAGDVVSIIAPGSADATLADIGFCLAGTR